MLTRCNGNPVKLIIIHEDALVTDNLIKYYGNDFIAIGLPKHYKAKERAEMIKELEPVAKQCQVTLCANGDMFKQLAKVKKTTGQQGIPFETALGTTFLAYNYTSLMYGSITQDDFDAVNKVIRDYLNGNYTVVGANIIHSGIYPSIGLETANFLNTLMSTSSITIDIETTGLHHCNSEILTIGFATDLHHGGVVEYKGNEAELARFFLNYKGIKIFHNASFDVTHLIYHLFMKNEMDIKGMVDGLDIMCNKLEDTFLISYLCLNSCGKTELGLKKLAQQFAGNYAEEDIGNASSIPMDELKEYNLKDCLATWYVFNKYAPKLSQEKQTNIYYEIFLPSLKTLIQTQLVGLRIYPDRLNSLKNDIESNTNKCNEDLLNNPTVKTVTNKLKYDSLISHNEKVKTEKGKWTIDHPNIQKIQFNPNSDDDVRKLLFDTLGLPSIDTTDTGKESVKTKILESLLNYTKDENIIGILNNLIELKKASKIMSDFLPNFEEAKEVDGMKALYGFFKLGGTKSGRISSNSPNLMNLPSTGSKYAKPVKALFGAPKGFVFCGADFASLEDRISALTTKDPNKLKVYTDGFDGHCMRAYSYFGNQMPDIKQVPLNIKCYRITLDDGSVELLTEDEFNEKYGE